MALPAQGKAATAETAPQPTGAVAQRCRRTREDRCPGVLRQFPAADGYLARIRTPGGRVSAAQLEAVARAAAELGNGVIELTSRANLQLRGLGRSDGARLAELLASCGLFPSASHDRVRNVLASPLAGRHPTAQGGCDPLLRALDRGICAKPALAALSGRFLFAIEDGSGIGMRADWDLAAVAVGKGWLLGIAGTLWQRPQRGPLAEGEIVELLLAAAKAFLELRERLGLTAWRLVDLEGAETHLATALGLVPAAITPPSPKRLEEGALRQRDGLYALTVRTPQGRITPEVARALSRIAPGGVRLSPERTLTVLDVPPAEHRHLFSLLQEVVCS
jgi:precorrin-3B synthase